jgi:hypothetical protein
MTIHIPKGPLVAVLVIALVLAAAAAGYFIGYAAADHDGAFARGEREGHTAGVREGIAEGEATGYADGRADALAEFRPGEPAYRRIYQRGRRAGEAAGYSAGSSDAFAGFDGGWEIGGWYIVHFAQPQGGQRYNIESRIEMETGESYNICPQDADEICGGELF